MRPIDTAAPASRGRVVAPAILATVSRAVARGGRAGDIHGLERTRK